MPELLNSIAQRERASSQSTTSTTTRTRTDSTTSTTTRSYANSNIGAVHNYDKNFAGIWWYTCRCRTPFTHFDAKELTDAMEIEGANYALDLAGMDVMSRPMLWQILETYWPENEGLMHGVRSERGVMERFWGGRMV